MEAEAAAAAVAIATPEKSASQQQPDLLIDTEFNQESSTSTPNEKTFKRTWSISDILSSPSPRKGIPPSIVTSSPARGNGETVATRRLSNFESPQAMVSPSSKRGIQACDLTLNFDPETPTKKEACSPTAYSPPSSPMGEDAFLVPEDGYANIMNSPTAANKKDEAKKDALRIHANNPVESKAYYERLWGMTELKAIEFLHQSAPSSKGMIENRVVVDEFARGTKEVVMYNANDEVVFTAKRKRGWDGISYYAVYVHTSKKADMMDAAPAESRLIAKVRGNLMGSEFRSYDNGKEPGKARGMIDVRKQVCVVQFAATFGYQPRALKVFIPKVEEHEGMDANSVSFTARQFKMYKREGDDLGVLGTNIIKMAGGDAHLPAAAEGAEEKGIGLYINQAPVWNPSEGMYTLDFRGRVTVASVKNFLLERPLQETPPAEQSNTSTSASTDGGEEEKSRETVLIFGRTGNEPDEYSLDFSFPFSPLQAFCCALSSVDSHMICE